jgi:hypothetical protein
VCHTVALAIHNLKKKVSSSKRRIMKTQKYSLQAKEELRKLKKYSL